MILIIDNYDSFTYNLYQYVGEMANDEILVIRNDAKTLEEIHALAPTVIIISPGPGYPKDAGLTIPVVREFAGKTPILGVCLGFQGIVEAFGGKIIKAKTLMHGKSCSANLDLSCSLFEGLPSAAVVARYHSLAAEPSSLPSVLKVTATAPDGEIMAVAHNEYPLYGVQFHPESIMTNFGKKILRNFLSQAGISLRPDNNTEIKADALKPYIQKVVVSENLSESEALDAMDNIMSGNATNAQIGSFLTAMRMKGETTEEITGFAKSMRGKALAMEELKNTIDIVGTGGDLARTFNISTTSAFVVAAAGVRVSKHGNRSVSSLSGSADVLEALGVKIDISPEQAIACLNETNLCFMFAPVFHKSMRFAAPPRKEIGVRSVFNILGPLTNPAKAEYMLLGVYDSAIMEQMANVLGNLGVKRALVVHGKDGLDEVTVTGRTEICEIDDTGRITKYEISPEDFGLPLYKPSDLVGGNAKDNAKILLNILNGEKGAKRDTVVMNSAAAIFTAGAVPTFEDALSLAQKTIDSGAAYEKLQQVIRVTESV
ncbi:bifunctional protein TrpGD [Clostridia bacterium]|nr:bifunctional protein TrpGD [Clostridia bacterium]